MPTGTYNISRLLRELGLKNVAEMPLRESIQPVIPLASMAGQVPVHVGSVALSGGVASAAAAQRSAFQLQILDPGGAVLQWVHDLSDNVSGIFTSETPLVWSTGPTLTRVVQFNNGVPSPSIMNMGAVAGGALLTDPEIGELMPVAQFAPLYIPRGHYLQIIDTATNDEFRLTVCWCGITATEGGD